MNMNHICHRAIYFVLNQLFKKNTKNIIEKKFPQFNLHDKMNELQSWLNSTYWNFILFIWM
jgi:hypothetical protein